MRYYLKIKFLRIAILLLATVILSNNIIAKDKIKPRLEPLLKEAKVEYIKTEDGSFKIPITVEGETSMIIAYENRFHEDDPSTDFIGVATFIMDLPDNYTIPLALLKEINEINYNLDFGRVVIDPEGTAVLFLSGLWSNPTKSDNLINELYHTHYSRMGIRKQLLPYINE